MATPLANISIKAPGFKGLNLEDSAVDLDPSWSLVANNCVIDSLGRLGSRKGWDNVNTSSLGSYDIVALHEYVNAAGSTEIISAANANIYKGTTTLTSVYSTAITNNYWKIVNFNGKCYFFQNGEVPLTYDGTTCQTIASVAGFADANGVMAKKPNEVLAAYGRLWVADTSTDKTTIWYSDTLIGHAWSGGASGSIDLRSVWTDGMDSITALAAFNGFLIVFGKKSIVVYQGANNPSTMSLSDIVKGIGCVARDSVKDVGTDIIFLSDSGVRSFQRTIQEKSMPVRDLSKNVRTDLISYLAGETANKIKSVYHEKEGFYLLTFPTYMRTYCFDMRVALPDGSARTTVWNSINPKSFVSLRNRSLYMGQTGHIGEYTGYTDNGTNYRIQAYTPWLDYGDASRDKFFKDGRVTVIGGAGASIISKWAFDYSAAYNSSSDSITTSGLSEWGIAEWGLGEWTIGIAIDVINPIGTESGKVMQFGIEAEGASSISIQKIELYAKVGRTA